jgi:hypothetical protein
MLCCSADIYSRLFEPAEKLRIEELKDKLEAVWGKKLGGEKSKEARSARWVYTALCDLKGNVQARDLVRFLKYAADYEHLRTGQQWSDRVLSPESMRNAISKCSDEKVTEAIEEFAPLREWSETLKSIDSNHRKIPFGQDEVGLTAKLFQSLQDIGVIYEDVDSKSGEARLFLPEIYRHGLKFENSAVGRPRMQALLTKNIGSIPL